MTGSARPQVVSDYLNRLRVALADVPTEVSHEIVRGIAEELEGLGAEDAAERIRNLGDPAFIAAAARSETKEAGSAQRLSPGPVTGDPRWYVVLASLLVAVGGVVIPVLGLIGGLAMVWLSRTWQRWEKWVATLAAPGALVLLVLLSLLADSLRLGNFTWWHLAILSVFVAPFVVGVWLLWRGLHRSR